MSRTPSIVVVGDLVVDRDLTGTVERVCPDAPVPVLDVDSEVNGPGAAGLTALLCTGSGVEVTLVAPVADDEDGQLLRTAMSDAGIRLVELDQEGPTRRKTRARSVGQSLLRIDEGGPAAPRGPLPTAALEAVEQADVVLVSCYGAGVTDHPQLRRALTERARRRVVVWDPHPRGGAPVPGCTVVTPNVTEATALLGTERPGEELARGLVEHWSAQAVCVTDGGAGAWLAATAGEPVHVPTARVEGDPCGAGDAFAAAAARALATGRTTSEAVAVAVETAGRWVRAGGASGYRRAAGEVGSLPSSVGTTSPDASDPQALGERIRAQGGTLVASGGCFDVLHAGHLACLEAARELGDALVVLINSDESVRRLKGPGRPVHCAADRARMLRALSCVDDVIVFDESSPVAALEQLKPDVWVKGGDYEGARLPEAELVRSWGGRVVLLPYLTGHSTTAILADAQ